MREGAARSPEPRAVLVALVRRAGGAVDIANAELYDAMMTNHGTRVGQFVVEAVPDGIRLCIAPETDRQVPGTAAGADP